ELRLQLALLLGGLRLEHLEDLLLLELLEPGDQLGAPLLEQPAAMLPQAIEAVVDDSALPASRIGKHRLQSLQPRRHECVSLRERIVLGPQRVKRLARLRVLALQLVA